MGQWDVINGDCLDVLRAMEPNSVDAVVTDPPYGLSFMGKKWDYDVPAVEVWTECLRVLKPGGHLLAFAGTRTQHRMAVRIEDAGFEIRDMLTWVYGSGFPKSHDVSKAMDRAAGAEREVVGSCAGATNIGRNTDGKRGYGHDGHETGGTDKTVYITAPSTDLARQWSGWGTALKPALEPITLARKPLCGTVAENVTRWGTGAVNVDGCRVGTTVETWPKSRSYGGGTEYAFTHTAGGVVNSQPTGATPSGRWPANFIHDGSDEVCGLFPDARGAVSNGSKGETGRNGIYNEGWGVVEQKPGHNDSGSAARFFYCAKASKRDRDAGCGGVPVVSRQGVRPGSPDETGKFPDHDHRERTGNHHPTVKPTDLMRYLCRLVTPPGGLVLDPFTGSGSTGRGAVLEGFRFVGIEREAEYCTIARARIEHAASEAATIMQGK